MSIWGDLMGNSAAGNFGNYLRQERASVLGLGQAAQSNISTGAAMQAAQNAALNDVYTHTNGASVGWGQAQKAVNFNPNEHPAYQMTLASLCDLWVAQWGDIWVSGNDIDKTHNAEFWHSATERLWGTDLMECVDSTEYWYRIKE